MAGDSCANPLLLEWIKEWLDEARERNSKGVNVYVLCDSSHDAYLLGGNSFVLIP